MDAVIELKTPGEIDAIAAAGRVVADVLATLRAKAAPGVTPRQLDDIASDMIADAGAVSSFRGYHPRWAPGPYPAVTCISVNDAVVHGVPGKRPLKPGDLLSVDFAVHLDGWCADAAFSVVVGDRPDPRDLALIDATERALAAGIAAMAPGARLGDVAHAIGTVARGAGFGMLADHGGHGVGRSMHEEPHVRQRGQGAPRAQAAAGAGDRDRAHAHRGRHRRLPPRPRRLDHPHRRRLPRGPRRSTPSPSCPTAPAS